MKKLLLAITLSALSFTASAAILKLPKDTLMCSDLVSIQMLHRAAAHSPKEEFQEVIKYLDDNRLCGLSAEAIVRVIDVSSPFVYVEAISTTGRAWVHSRDLK